MTMKKFPEELDVWLAECKQEMVDRTDDLKACIARHFREEH